MTLEPLLNASPVIQVHAFAGMSALALGAIQIAAPKGTIPHRTFGWIWLALMMVMLLSSPVVHGAKLQDLFGPGVCEDADRYRAAVFTMRCASIHLITVFLIFAVPFGPLLARHGQIKRHRHWMIAFYAAALMIAAGFTADTHRIMHAVLFGSPH